jgi:hypothetical protein
MTEMLSQLETELGELRRTAGSDVNLDKHVDTLQAAIVVRFRFLFSIFLLFRSRVF